jgi:4-azaleucine resistance transporter AzlC
MAMASPDIPFTRAGFRRGFVAALPLFPGVAIYGVMFGAIAAEAGLSMAMAAAMSTFIYSGTAQMASVQGIASGASLLAVMLTVATINARYVLYGATLEPWLGGLPWRKIAPALFCMGDGNWLISTRAHEQGEMDGAFFFGCGIACFLPWVPGTLAGHWLGGLVKDPSRFGVDFMLVAFAAASAVGMVRGRGDIVPALVAAAVSVAVFPWAGAGWSVVAAGIAGGVAMALLWKPAP